MRRLLSHSLMLRVVVPVAVVLVLLFAGIIAMMAWLSMNDARADLVQRAERTTSILSGALALSAWSFDWERGQQQLASLKADPDYAGSIVWDEYGHVVAKDGQPDHEAANIVRTETDLIYKEKNGTVHRVGHMAVSLGTDRVKDELIERLAKIALVGLAGLLVICAVLAYLVQGLIRPINALTQAMTGLAGGDTQLAVPHFDRQDEIGRMAEAIEVFVGNAIALKVSEARLRTLLTTIPDPVWLKDPNGIYLACNPEFERFFGAEKDMIVGRSDHDIVAPDLAEIFRQKDLETLAAGRPVVYEQRLLIPGDGHHAYLETIKTPMIDDEGQVVGILGIARDITARKQAEEEIEYLAYHDPLTGLPNRRLLLDRLQRALASGSRSRREGGLMLIDLDNFKSLNDTHGHEAGDMLLQQVSQRLTHCVRQEDTVARLGGDEFVVMLVDLSENTEEAAGQIRAIGEKILSSLSPQFALPGGEHHSTVSIGATLFGPRPIKADELLKQVDIAMYQAKADGRNSLRFFDPDLQSAVQARSRMEADLRQALKDGLFELYYQPQVDSSGRILGAEALLRWRHPEQGFVSPADFIPLAEETGLILPIGDWVLETGCAQIVAWAGRPETAHLTLSLNVSARQFRQEDFVGRVLQAIGNAGADPRKLKLELTESMLLSNVQDVIDKMTLLKDQGLRFSLDDFGTGYSSLAYLKRLPLDQLKIDQSFVRDVLVDPNDAVIARTVVALARSFGLAVIAEGVETEGQRQFLAAHGCTDFQGYLFAPPVPAAEFAVILEAQNG